MLKISDDVARLLSKMVMVAQVLAAIFFGYLWATRRNFAQPAGRQLIDFEQQYFQATITAYAALAITCALLAVVMFFIRKSTRLMRLFTECGERC
ncbi:hypothetical protein I2I05_12130 [Hymenobacter sp. BT683]|uniref:Uncharacterized protein n=1 Tax=Hymenobacter jeongseonensis TaxID=2791027 RepID=A0ABS0IK65_9BACT|nr:hypothetical protein [Hymenobacter jeongseonensis]MBF9238145.1 hypothetical protein [Hymenobacter jeongseonensis]